jgi:hypothetical protein
MIDIGINLINKRFADTGIVKKRKKWSLKTPQM